MKSRTLLSLILLLVADFGFCQDWVEDKENLNGRVKSIQHSIQDYATNDYVDYLKGDDLYFYNESGFLVKTDFNYMLDQHYIRSRVYDVTGTKCLTEFVIEDMDTAGRFDFEYDSLGRVKTSVYSSQGFEYSTTRYVHQNTDSENQNSRIYKKYCPECLIIELDSKGRKIKESDIPIDGKIIKTWQYDDRGNLTEEKSDLQIPYLETDAAANPNDHRHYTITYQYDELNRCTLEVYQRNYDDSVLSEVSYVYNDFGDIAFKNQLDPKSGKKYVERFTYEYDSHTNWIRKAVYHEDGIRSSETRAITYYPDLQTNWVSVDYLNCLRSDLPCQCERSSEIFLLEIYADDERIIPYNGRENYDAGSYDFSMLSPNVYHVYYREDSEILALDSVYEVAQVQLVGDTLVYSDNAGKKTKFVSYEAGNDHGYLSGHISWLNEQFEKRGYSNLNEILKEDSLKCWCNWELHTMNVVFSDNGHWILEKQDDELAIYKWTNPPKAKRLEIKIKKKKVKSFKW